MFSDHEQLRRNEFSVEGKYADKRIRGQGNNRIFSFGAHGQKSISIQLFAIIFMFVNRIGIGADALEVIGHAVLFDTILASLRIGIDALQSAVIRYAVDLRYAAGQASFAHQNIL